MFPGGAYICTVFDLYKINLDQFEEGFEGAKEI